MLPYEMLQVFLLNDMKLSSDDAIAYLRSLTGDVTIDKFGDELVAMAGKASAGARSSKGLMKKKQIPDPLKALMGEVTDPTERADKLEAYKKERADKLEAFKKEREAKLKNIKKKIKNKGGSNGNEAGGGMLKGNQKKLDADGSGTITANDFQKLRNRDKMVSKKYGVE